VRVELTASEIKVAVKAALAEDIGGGDVTTLATVPKTLTFKTVMRARTARRRRAGFCEDCLSPAFVGGED
jgi:nicotinate-nucleotide pyrophosphorylase